MLSARVKGFIALAIIAGTVAAGVRDAYKFRQEERTKRKMILDAAGLEVAAIQRATDVVNARIERGEIRNYDDLRDAVVTEVAFQKIAIHEDEA